MPRKTLPAHIVNRIQAPAGQTAVLVETDVEMADGKKITANPDGTNAGFNVGTHSADPSSLVNGDLWYTGTELKARVNGATIALGSGGGGGGSVTSVAQTFTGGLISVAGSPVTGAGTLALTIAGTSGGIPYFSSSSTWETSAALTSNALVLGGGAGAAPKVVAGIKTDGTAQLQLGVNATTLGSIKLYGNTSGDVTIAPNAVAGTSVALTLPATSGTLLSSGTAVTVAQGGTGLTALGTALQFLRVNAAGDALEYGSAPAAAAGTLTGTTLAAGVVNSSLTTLGTLTALDVAASSAVNLVTPGVNDINVNSGGQLTLVSASQLNVVAPLLNFVGTTSGIVVQFKDAAGIVEITAANGATLNGSQLLTVDGDGSALTGISVAVGDIGGLGANVGTFLATPSSANLLAALTTKTGTGNAVFATSPTLTTPNLGTPSAVTLTNGTGLPLTGLAGFTTAIKSTDTTRSATTTVADDPHLTGALTAGTYRFEAALIFSNDTGGTTPGEKFKLAYSGTYTTATGTLEIGPHAGAGIRGGYPNSSDADIFVPTFSDSNRNEWGVVRGILVATGSGTLSVQWAQSTSSATVTRLKAGSYLRIEKL